MLAYLVLSCLCIGRAGRYTMLSTHEITRLLGAWSAGDEHALEQLIPMVYDELHRLAQIYMGREHPEHTLQTTALVHEAYLRLVDAGRSSLQDRAHFFAVCAQLMRRILVDWARTRLSLKRGGDIRMVDLDEALTVSPDGGTDLVALDDALKTLETIDPRKSKVIELRFFGGLSVQETADVLKVSEDTVTRDWKFAQSWLRRELRKGAASGA
jgi:RNA polymerase sigma factor (TIGR02999 family)